MSLYLYAFLVFSGACVLRIVIDWFEEREIGGRRTNLVCNLLYIAFCAAAIILTPGYSVSVVFQDGIMVTITEGLSSVVLFAMLPSLLGIMTSSVTFIALDLISAGRVNRRMLKEYLEKNKNAPQ